MDRSKLVHIYQWMGLSFIKMRELGVDPAMIEPIRLALNTIHDCYDIADVVEIQGEWPNNPDQRWEALK